MQKQVREIVPSISVFLHFFFYQLTIMKSI